MKINDITYGDHVMTQSPILFVIPTRLAATRLPRKPLLDIHGFPMIYHVWSRVHAMHLGRVVVACGDQEIAETLNRYGAETVLTDPALPSGTDRVWAAAQIVDPKGEYPLIVNVQGDQPAIGQGEIEALIKLFDHESDMVTLATPMDHLEDAIKPNIVKVVMSFDDSMQPHYAAAHYFSRSLIPHGANQWYQHIGLYGYRRESLQQFVKLPPSPLEVSEKLEQLRALEAGMKIIVGLIDHVPLSVDTPEDLEIARDVIGLHH